MRYWPGSASVCRATTWPTRSLPKGGWSSCSRTGNCRCSTCTCYGCREPTAIRRCGRESTSWPGEWRREPLAPRLLREVAAAHQVFVDGARALAAFADRPHHQRLAAAHVSGSEHLCDAGAEAGIFIAYRFRVAAYVAFDAQRVE